MLSTILAIAAAILVFSLLALGVALIAKKFRFFKEEGTTVQLQAIPEPGSATTLPGGPSVMPAGPRLRETSVAAWAARVIALEGSAVTIGRAITNTIVLPEDPVSSEHCRIERQGSSFRIVDLGSTNKTWVNGRKADDAILRHGDQIRVGRTTFVFENEKRPN